MLGQRKMELSKKIVEALGDFTEKIFEIKNKNENISLRKKNLFKAKRFTKLKKKCDILL